MTGTILVHAEPAGLGRAGVLGVVVDGVAVGEVRQGGAARFAVAAGTHTVRVTTMDRARSNTVTVELTEGQEFVVTVRGTGLAIAVLLPVVTVTAAPVALVLGAIVLLGVLLVALPGLLFRVRADGVRELRPAAENEGRAERRAGAPEGVDAEPGEGGGTGLWWESDPAFAKRFPVTSTV
ncbi:hypothetical protein [Kitasatospora sp. NPDC059571]|uniref:hypothetical protein n=1 Tax=Kitasatospora sp. NPDC059571 TaxID=3346871 RepID=UPI0036BD79DE